VLLIRGKGQQVTRRRVNYDQTFNETAIAIDPATSYGRLLYMNHKHGCMPPLFLSSGLILRKFLTAHASASAKPPAGSRGRAPGQGGGRSPHEADSILAFER